MVATLSAASWEEQLNRGNFQFDHGLYREAAADYGAALPLANAPRDRAVTLYRLALAKGKLAQYTEAGQLYGQALDIFRAQGDPTGSALALAGIGEALRLRYRLDEALAAEQDALGILKSAGLGETRQAAGVFTIAGDVLTDMHRYKAAEQNMREALAVLEKTAGTDSPDFATSLNNLGVIAARRGHWDEAERVLERALAIREAVLGNTHPLVAGTLLSLSEVYLDQKRYADAERTGRRSLEMLRRFLPGNHPDVIKARMGLALIAHRSGNSAEELEARQ